MGGQARWLPCLSGEGLHCGCVLCRSPGLGYCQAGCRCPQFAWQGSRVCTLGSVPQPPAACPCCLLPAACSEFKYDKDDNGIDIIVFEPPSSIKQNQGGLRRSRGAEMLDLDPVIKIYRGATPYLDGFDILEEDAKYRETAYANSSKKERCDRLFLQMKHYNSKAGEQKVCG